MIAALLLALTSMLQGPVVVQPTTDARQELPPSESLRLYEVRDLVTARVGSMSVDDPDPARAELEGRIQRYLASQRALGRGDPADGAALDARFEALERERRVAEDSRELARIVRTFVEPKLSGPAQKVEAPSASGTLVVRATDAQHAWIDAFLTRQRRAVDTIELQARFLVGPRGCFKELTDQVSKTFARKEALDTALAGIKVQFDEILAPRVVCSNLQQASIETVNETAYIKDYDVRFVEPGPRQIADPVIDTIRDGIFLKARTFELADGLYGVCLDTTLVQLKRPIRTAKVRISVTDAEEVEIALPEVSRVHFSSDVQIGDGGAALFLMPFHDDTDMALVVSVRRGPPASELPVEGR